MKELSLSLKEDLKRISKDFLENSKGKEVFLVSHFDADGITSATIASKALKALDIKFNLKIVKYLKEDFFDLIPKDKVILFLDLASGSLNYIKERNFKDVYIIDHHEISQEIPSNVKIINPWLHKKEKISSSGLTYLFFKEILPEIDSSEKLAIIGMIGDLLDKEVDYILSDSASVKKIKGIMMYPATRPINKVLEFCSNPYIPKVTGNPEGVKELLREAGLEPVNGKYKSIVELDENEMKKLVSAIILRNPKINKELVGDIFLVKFFNKLEDAREISAIINACSRLGYVSTAIKFCMEIQEAKKEAEEIYAKYKKSLISALEFLEKSEKILGDKYLIINAKNKIPDTIIGTVATILSNSGEYEEGTLIITLAHSEEKIKVSGRVVGKNGRNVRELLESVVKEIGGEVGGHENAAGCIISKDKESDFLNKLIKYCELEIVRL
ncbi:MAG: single-stranded DNA endonuclease [Candidatus Pacearchaeota archaeon]|nr:MAG: single-stranded DNA endonuclease [Candidatus Pacearchaeota archaeon]